MSATPDHDTDTDLDWDAVPEGVSPEAYQRTREMYEWQRYDGGDVPLGEDGTWLDSHSLTAWVRERSPVTLVAFSMGKDSIATLERCLEFWARDEIVCFHLSSTPGMGFQTRSLDYYRKHYGVRILHLPHISTFRYLNSGTFQPPHHLPVIWGADLPDLDYPDVYWFVADYVGWTEQRPWVAQGIRASDSPMRRMLIQRNGPWNAGTRVFQPIWDWYVKDLRELLDRTGVRLPVDYRLFGRTYDGLDYRFTEPLRDTFPEDYERIRSLYPFMELERWRRGGPKPDERD